MFRRAFRYFDGQGFLIRNEPQKILLYNCPSSTESKINSANKLMIKIRKTY
jgi:hypothetical protein